MFSVAFGGWRWTQRLFLEDNGHGSLQVDYQLCQQCHCGVSRSGGLGLEPPGVPSVDPSDQNLLSTVAEATTLEVHHPEEELDREGGWRHMLIMVQ